MDHPRPTPPEGEALSSPERREELLRNQVAELAEERRRFIRQRRIHLILLGLAVSLPLHIALIIWLANIHKTLPPAGTPTPIVLDLSVLPDAQLEEMLDPLDSEEMLTPEPQSSAGENQEALEEELTAELPTAELVKSDGGALSSVSGGEVGEGLGTGLGAGSGAGASFFGVEAGGNRIAYILDISGSMRNSAKMGIAMAELKRSIRSLPDYAAFAVVLYANQPTMPSFQRGWLRASSQNIRRVEQWIDSVSPGGGTEPIPAFNLVFGMDVRPDAIFFMTDGLIPGDTVPAVSALNGGGKHVQINCIAFGTEAGQGALRRLAGESDGIFKFVPVGGMRP